MVEHDRPGNFQTIEAARGIAALLVVLFHDSNSFFPEPRLWNATAFGRVFDFGYAGVEFFFVLSGFIIAHVHSADIGRPARLRRYALRRLARIYPAYWIVLAGVLAIAGLHHLPSASTIVQSVLLVGRNSRPTVLDVAWTLYHEVAFYVVFGLWIIDRRLGLAVSAVWLLVVLARWLGMGNVPFVPPYLAREFNLLFLFGIAAWAVSRRGRIVAPCLVALAAAVAFVAIGLDAVYAHAIPKPTQHVLFGVAAAVGLAAITNRERHRPVAVPPLLLALGAASYSIYLVHYPLLWAMAEIAGKSRLRDHVVPEIAFVATVAIAVAGGCAFHRLIERPVLRAVQRGLGMAPQPAR